VVRHRRFPVESNTDWPKSRLPSPPYDLDAGHPDANGLAEDLVDADAEDQEVV
jgi:hypothetical protein